MDEEIKKKLEEIRSKQHKELPDHLALTWEYNAAWMAGAQAAWDLAVKAERIRCAKLAASILGVDVSEAILNTRRGEE